MLITAVSDPDIRTAIGTLGGYDLTDAGALHTLVTIDPLPRRSANR